MRRVDRLSRATESSILFVVIDRTLDYSTASMLKEELSSFEVSLSVQAEERAKTSSELLRSLMNSGQEMHSPLNI